MTKMTASMPSGDRTTPTASAVLSELETGAAPGEVAKRLGISKQRVSAIMRKAGFERRVRRPTERATTRTKRGEALLVRLVRDAATAQLDPEAYLDAAFAALVR